MSDALEESKPGISPTINTNPANNQEIANSRDSVGLLTGGWLPFRVGASSGAAWRLYVSSPG